MQQNVRSRVRMFWGVVLGAVLVAGTGCQISGTPTTAPRPTVLGSDTPPAATPPWTLAELVNHPCTMLGPDDLSRFGITGSGEPALNSRPSYCRWRTPGAESGGARMVFAPNPWERFGSLEEIKREEANFRTLQIAGRAAFLVDRHRESRRNCMIWVQVASGGLFQVEYIPESPVAGQDVCGPAIELAGTIAERIR
ncbi:DUF3558 domain-containing protein [Nocardia goodfellowii]